MASPIVSPPSNEVDGFDFKVLQDVPQQFIWSSKDLMKSCSEKLDTPLIDLKAIKNDEVAMAKAAKLVREACMKHGFFEVTNHGVDHDLIIAAYKEAHSIFELPLSKKISASKNHWGYSCAHTDKFSTNLPWKEMITYRYNFMPTSESHLVDSFKDIFGQEFQHAGLVNQRYCDAIKEVSMSILELLGISLGIDGSFFQKFFEDCESIVRFNRYPSCKTPDLTLGVGPHCDPTSLTILHQDQVSGLEVYVDDKWIPVLPRPETPDAFVINIGDTLEAMTNGLYKSCVHRVIVNEKVDRKSFVMFLNPKGDKTVKPPENLLESEDERKYPDFTWAQFYGFTQQHHRADADTLPSFVSWLRNPQTTTSISNFIWN